MRTNVALVLYYTKANRYSFNALVGAVESSGDCDNLTVHFVERENHLITGLRSLIEMHEKVVVGFSFFTTQLWDVHRVVKRLRAEYCDRLILIAGGPHPTGDPLGTLRMGFDLVVRGEGEQTLLELLDKIDGGEDYTSVEGLAFINEKGEYCYTGRRAWLDLDRYPPFAVKHGKFGHIEITRGCPYACYFCQTPHILGGHPRHRSVENISEYVEISKRRGLTDIRFITPNAFSYGSHDGKKIDILSLEALLSSVRRIIEPNGRLFFGSFPSEVRPEHVLSETLELILRYTDNDNLIIGAQSGSQRILDVCHRGHTVEDVYRAVELTVRAGLKANVDFIFGLPGESDEDIGLTIKVMAELVRIGARMHVHTFLPLPQTPLSKAPAGRVSNGTRRMIDDLTSRDAAYGDWREQERIARKIAGYLRTGKLGT